MTHAGALRSGAGRAPDPLAHPRRQRGIGVVVPYDMALDRELWRWVPDEVSLYLTRTPYQPLGVTTAMLEKVGDHDDVARCVRDLSVAAPEVCAYACTSGSFLHGRAGERELTAAMASGGVPALTTSGALVEALDHLGARRVAICTPYTTDITARLVDFLAEVGVTTVHAAALGLTEGITTVPYATTAELVRACVAACGGRARIDAVVVSCTNLPTYDLLAGLETELGLPVVSANQVTMWAALRRLGVAAPATGQRLFAAPTSPSDGRDEGAHRG